MSVFRLPVENGVAWVLVDEIAAVVPGPKSKGPGATSVVYSAWFDEGMLVNECPAKLGQRWRAALEDAEEEGEE